MVARVPTVSRQIDAAAKGQLIVNHHDLLVMAGAYWMVIIEFEADAAWHTPSHPPPRQRLTLEREQRAVVPDQDVTQAPRTRFAMKAISASSRVGASSLSPREVDGRYDIPTEDGQQRRALRAAPVSPAENSQPHPDTVKAVRAVEPPAVPSWLDDRPPGTCLDVVVTLRGTAYSAGPRTAQGAVDEPRQRQRHADKHRR